MIFSQVQLHINRLCSKFCWVSDAFWDNLISKVEFLQIFLLIFAQFYTFLSSKNLNFFFLRNGNSIKKPNSLSNLWPKFSSLLLMSFKTYLATKFLFTWRWTSLNEKWNFPMIFFSFNNFDIWTNTFLQFNDHLWVSCENNFVSKWTSSSFILL